MSYNVHRLHRSIYGKVIDKKLKKGFSFFNGKPVRFQEKKTSNLKNILQVQKIIRTEEFIYFYFYFYSFAT